MNNVTTYLPPFVRELADRILVLLKDPKRRQHAAKIVAEACERQSAAYKEHCFLGSLDIGYGNTRITRYRSIPQDKVEPKDGVSPSDPDWPKPQGPELAEIKDDLPNVTYRDGWPFPIHFDIDTTPGCVLIAAAINDYAAECPTGFDPRHTRIGPTEIGGAMGAFCTFLAGVEAIQPEHENALRDVVSATELAMAENNSTEQASDGDEPPVASGSETEAGKSPPKVPAKLKPSVQRAWVGFKHVEPQLASGATDDDAYAALLELKDEHALADNLPAKDTWKRYVREARKHHGQNKNSPRAGRAADSRSIVKQSDI